MAARYNAWLPPKLIYLAGCRAGLRNVFSEIDSDRCIYLRIGSNAMHKLYATLNVSVVVSAFRTETVGGCKLRSPATSGHGGAYGGERRSLSRRSYDISAT